MCGARAVSADRPPPLHLNRSRAIPGAAAAGVRAPHACWRSAARGTRGVLMDANCPICRDELAALPPDGQLFTLACGHVFCAACLQS